MIRLIGLVTLGLVLLLLNGLIDTLYTDGTFNLFIKVLSFVTFTWLIGKIFNLIMKEEKRKD